MLFEAFDRWVRTLPGVTFDVKWDVHRTYCIGDKMFVMAGDLGQDAPRYLFKASELGFEMLVQSGAAAPAAYLGRAKWVHLLAPDSLEDEDLKAYVHQAYGLIAAKLPKRQRTALGVGA